MNNKIPTCYCGNIMFIDGDEYLCPSRFDGQHSPAQQEKYVQLRQVRADNGRLGGQARARNLTPDQTRSIAQRAAHARWTQKEK